MGDDILVGLQCDLDSDIRKKVAEFMFEKFNYTIDSSVEPSSKFTLDENKLSSFLRYRLHFGLPIQAG